MGKGNFFFCFKSHMEGEGRKTFPCGLKCPGGRRGGGPVWGDPEAWSCTGYPPPLHFSPLLLLPSALLHGRTLKCSRLAHQWVCRRGQLRPPPSCSLRRCCAAVLDANWILGGIRSAPGRLVSNLGRL